MRSTLGILLLLQSLPIAAMKTAADSDSETASFSFASARSHSSSSTNSQPDTDKETITLDEALAQFERLAEAAPHEIFSCQDNDKLTTDDQTLLTKARRLRRKIQSLVNIHKKDARKKNGEIDMHAFYSPFPTLLSQALQARCVGWQAMGDYIYERNQKVVHNILDKLEIDGLSQEELDLSIPITLVRQANQDPASATELYFKTLLRPDSMDEDEKAKLLKDLLKVAEERDQAIKAAKKSGKTWSNCATTKNTRSRESELPERTAKTSHTTWSYCAATGNVPAEKNPKTYPSSPMPPYNYHVPNTGSTTTSLYPHASHSYGSSTTYAEERTQTADKPWSSYCATIGSIPVPNTGSVTASYPPHTYTAGNIDHDDCCEALLACLCCCCPSDD